MKIRLFQKELEKWMMEEGDLGVYLDTQRAHRADKLGAHLF